MSFQEAIYTERKEARQEGLQEGRQEGLQEGKNKERSEIIKQLRAAGVDESVIEQIQSRP